MSFNKFLLAFISIHLFFHLLLPLASPEVLTNEQEDEFDIESINTSTVESRFSFHGRLDISFIHFRDDKNVDEFDEYNFYPLSPALFFEYKLRDHLSGILEVEVDGEDEEIEIEQILLDWKIWKEYLRLKLGKTYFPFGIERYSYAPSANKLVDRPSPFRRIIPGTYSDIGIFLSGSYIWDNGFLLKYELAITNGLEGPRREDVQDRWDNNHNKQLGGRLGFSLEALELGISFALGEYDKHQKNQIDFFGGDFSYTGERLELKSEYVTNRVENPIALGGNFRRKGWYIQAAYKQMLERMSLHHVEYVVRFDSLDDDRKTVQTDIDRWSLGLVLAFKENLRFKAEYELDMDRHNNGLFLQMEYHW